MLLKDFCQVIPQNAKIRLRFFKNNCFQQETMILKQDAIDPIDLSKEVAFIRQTYYIQTLANNLIQVSQYYEININI